MLPSIQPHTTPCTWGLHSQKSSMKSKSKTKFRLAIKTTIKENMILNIDPLAGFKEINPILKNFL